MEIVCTNWRGFSTHTMNHMYCKDNRTLFWSISHATFSLRNVGYMSEDDVVRLAKSGTRLH